MYLGWRWGWGVVQNDFKGVLLGWGCGTKCKKTVHEAVDGYLDVYKQRVKFKTYENELYAAKHVKIWLGDKMVCDLKRIDHIKV